MEETRQAKEPYKKNRIRIVLRNGPPVLCRRIEFDGKNYLLADKEFRIPVVDVTYILPEQF